MPCIPLIALCIYAQHEAETPKPVMTGLYQEIYAAAAKQVRTVEISIDLLRKQSGSKETPVNAYPFTIEHDAWRLMAMVQR